jgi:hypothetical protein
MSAVRSTLYYTADSNFSSHVLIAQRPCESQFRLMKDVTSCEKGRYHERARLSARRAFLQLLQGGTAD